MGTDKATQAGAAAASGEQAANEPAVQTRPRRAVNSDKQDIQSWNALLEQKAVGHLHISVDDINKLFEKGGKAGVTDHAEQGDGNDTFVEVYMLLWSANLLSVKVF